MLFQILYFTVLLLINMSSLVVSFHSNNTAQKLVDNPALKCFSPQSLFDSSTDTNCNLRRSTYHKVTIVDLAYINLLTGEAHVRGTLRRDGSRHPLHIGDCAEALVAHGRTPIQSDTKAHFIYYFDNVKYDKIPFHSFCLQYSRYGYGYSYSLSFCLINCIHHTIFVPWSHYSIVTGFECDDCLLSHFISSYFSRFIIESKLYYIRIRKLFYYRNRAQRRAQRFSFSTVKKNRNNKLNCEKKHLLNPSIQQEDELVQEATDIGSRRSFVRLRFVKLDGMQIDSLPSEFDTTSLVRDLKLQVSESLGVKCSTIRFLFNGRPMSDLKRLSEYSLKDNSSIHVVYALTGGMKPVTGSSVNEDEGEFGISNRNQPQPTNEELKMLYLAQQARLNELQDMMKLMLSRMPMMQPNDIIAPTTQSSTESSTFFGDSINASNSYSSQTMKPTINTQSPRRPDYSPYSSNVASPFSQLKFSDNKKRQQEKRNLDFSLNDEKPSIDDQDEVFAAPKKDVKALELKDVSLFDGKTPFVDWLKLFNLTLSVRSPTEAVKLATLVQYLSSPIKMWLAELDESVYASYDALTRTIITQYKPEDDSGASYLAELQKLSLNDGEAVNSFAARMASILRKMENVGFFLTDAVVKQIFLNGLRPYSLQTETRHRLSDNSSVLDALRVAIKIEKDLRDTRNATGSTKSSNGNSSTKTNNLAMKCASCEKTIPKNPKKPYCPDCFKSKQSAKSEQNNNSNDNNSNSPVIGQQQNNPPIDEKKRVISKSDDYTIVRVPSDRWDDNSNNSLLWSPRKLKKDGLCQFCTKTFNDTTFHPEVNGCYHKYSYYMPSEIRALLNHKFVIPPRTKKV